MPVNDGYDYGAPRPGARAAAGRARRAGPAMGYAGTAEERGADQAARRRGDRCAAGAGAGLAVLLWGPLLRGTVVNAAHDPTEPSAPLVKLVVFAAVTLLLTAVLAQTLGSFGRPAAPATGPGSPT